MAGQLEKGRKIGQYEILEPLGKGGMASVYRAYQTSLDREVAIKVMAERYTSDPAFVERFRREARSIARLRHPNILTVFDAGDDNGLLYIVMELIDGPTLKEVMNNKPIALDKAENINTQIASALDYAHDAGIIHRDVKPSNVLMDKSGRAVLSDFGIIKMIGEQNNNLQLTNTGTGVGTPDYMSPEQAMGEGLDVRSDEYSLGIMFYEMMTGRPPFQGDTPIAIVMGHVSKPLPMPTKYNPDVPPSIEQVLLKALAKKPEDRYDTCGDFANSVKEAIAHPYSGFSTPKVESNMQPNVGLATPADHPEADRLYQEARRLEQQNNFHGAFVVFSRLHSQFSNYRDVPTMLERYRVMGYGQDNVPNWQRLVGSGTGSSAGGISNPGVGNLSNPSIPYGNINTGQTGPRTDYVNRPPTFGPDVYGNTNGVVVAPVPRRNSILPFILGGIAVLVIAAIAAVILIANSNKGSGVDTPTVQAVIPATKATTEAQTTDLTTVATSEPNTTAPITTVADSSTTIAPQTTDVPATSVATTLVATAPPTTVAPTSVATTTTKTASAKTIAATAGAIVYKPYKAPSGKYTTEIPDGWFISNSNSAGQDIDVFAATSSSTDQIGVNNLDSSGVDATTLDSFLGTILGSVGFTVKKTEDFTVNQVKGKLSTATFDSNGQTLNAKLFTFVKNNRLWIISYQALPNDEAGLSKIFDHVLQIFKSS